jgi:hypothetical protein
MSTGVYMGVRAPDAGAVKPALLPTTVSDGVAALRTVGARGRSGDAPTVSASSPAPGPASPTHTRLLAPAGLAAAGTTASASPLLTAAGRAATAASSPVGARGAGGSTAGAALTSTLGRAAAAVAASPSGGPLGDAVVDDGDADLGAGASTTLGSLSAAEVARAAVAARAPRRWQDRAAARAAGGAAPATPLAVTSAALGLEAGLPAPGAPFGGPEWSAFQKQLPHARGGVAARSAGVVVDEVGGWACACGVAVCGGGTVCVCVGGGNS